MAGTRQRVVQYGAQPGFGDGIRQAARAQGQRFLPLLGPSQQSGDQPRQKAVARAHGVRYRDWRFFARIHGQPIALQ